MEVSKALRMLGAIDSALAAMPDRRAVESVTAAFNAYYGYRAEVITELDPEELPEFERLFPERIPPPNQGGAVKVKQFMQATTLLASLRGWLEGIAQTARLQLEADAYARERVKAERTVGFRPERTQH